MLFVDVVPPGAAKAQKEETERARKEFERDHSAEVDLGIRTRRQKRKVSVLLCDVLCLAVPGCAVLFCAVLCCGVRDRADVCEVTFLFLLPSSFVCSATRSPAALGLSL